MKRFALVSKDDEVSLKIAKVIQTELINSGMELSQSNPEIVCVIGGDGTFLSAVQKYINQLDRVVFTGIHTGTLGFFVDYTLKQLRDCINDIVTKTPQIERKRLLQIYLKNQNKCFYSLNEVRVESSKTQNIDVYINDKKLESFHGCGITISTQSGSTAFNRAVGGAVIQPGLELMQMCEIAGIHHSHFKSIGNPVIVSGDTSITLVVNTYDRATLCFDRYEATLTEKEVINCTMSNLYVQFAHYQGYDWIKHLAQLF